MRGHDHELLRSKWITALGFVGPIERGARSLHPLPWLFELGVDGEGVIVTNDATTGRSWKGRAFAPIEFGLVCAAAELERTNASDFRSLLRELPRLPRPLAWKRFDPGCGLDCSSAGRWSLDAVLRRIDAVLTRAEVIEVKP
jgi:hypothetical protein